MFCLMLIASEAYPRAKAKSRSSTVSWAVLAGSLRKKWHLDSSLEQHSVLHAEFANHDRGVYTKHAKRVINDIFNVLKLFGFI